MIPLIEKNDNLPRIANLVSIQASLGTFYRVPSLTWIETEGSPHHSLLHLTFVALGQIPVVVVS